MIKREIFLVTTIISALIDEYLVTICSFYRKQQLLCHVPPDWSWSRQKPWTVIDLRIHAAGSMEILFRLMRFVGESMCLWLWRLIDGRQLAPHGIMGQLRWAAIQLTRGENQLPLHLLEVHIGARVRGVTSVLAADVHVVVLVLLPVPQGLGQLLEDIPLPVLPPHSNPLLFPFHLHVTPVADVLIVTPELDPFVLIAPFRTITSTVCLIRTCCHRFVLRVDAVRVVLVRGTERWGVPGCLVVAVAQRNFPFWPPGLSVAGLGAVGVDRPVVIQFMVAHRLSRCLVIYVGRVQTYNI